MKQEDHQDIIKQMADRLREHSVPYQEGAWERFRKVEKKKPRYLALWPYLSAAAAILIAVVLFLKPEEPLPITHELVEQNIKEDPNEGPLIKEEEIKEVESNLLASLPDKKLDLQSHAIKRNEKISLVSGAGIEKENLNDSEFKTAKESQIIKQENMTASNDNEREIQEDTVNENTVIKKVITESSAIVSVQEEKKEPIDFLAVLSTMKEDEDFVGNKDIKKWSVGLEVSPNMSSNKQVNMGGGIAFAYSVSPKVSFSSGVSYLQLDVERMPNIPSTMSAPHASPNPSEGFPVADFLSARSQVKTLNRVEANLIGLDIPFAINYHVNKNLYASVGVSVFNVLNEDRTNQFKSQEVNVLYSDDHKIIPEPVIQTFYSMEKANEKGYEGKGLNGFYNFSVGYSIPVSKKVGISVEPFFKIPMNSLRDDDMNLSNGGIKISTRF